MITEKDLKALYKRSNAALSLLIYNKMQRALNLNLSEIKRIVIAIDREHYEVDTFVEDVKKQLNIQVVTK